MVTYTSGGSLNPAPTTRSSSSTLKNPNTHFDLHATTITSGGNGNGTYSRLGQKGITVAQAEKDKAQAKAQKEARKLEMDQLLEETDDTTIGAFYVREAARAQKGKMEKAEADELKRKNKGKPKVAIEELPEESEIGEEEEEEEAVKKQQKKKRTNPFNVEALRRIGYDPTRDGAVGKAEDELERASKPQVSFPSGSILVAISSQCTLT